ncbi:hypothetical protein B0T10DRAFT_305332 [Thelonectria olida]|uniref:Uncharacterized protein n=1 Tax=Thelonectria olida TaxID=1576542 RepID=A0A9P8W601_9HYPO|nr:hypothetical protein B0T10DRAFT_305332 [Thelonectria olida]
MFSYKLFHLVAIISKSLAGTSCLPNDGFTVMTDTATQFFLVGMSRVSGKQTLFVETHLASRFVLADDDVSIASFIVTGPSAEMGFVLLGERGI